MAVASDDTITTIDVLRALFSAHGSPPHISMICSCLYGL